MKGVPFLCKGKSYEIETLVSPEDYEWVAARGNWFVTHGAKRDGKSYAVRSEGGRLVWLHKEVLLRAGVVPPCRLHIIGDHRNGDSLDNRRDNLRWATHQMNAMNRFGFIDLQSELPLWQ